MTTPVPVTGDYITLPIVLDPNIMQAQALAFLGQSMPGWVPRDGHLEVWMLEAFAQMASEAAVVANQVPLAIFQYFGQSLVGLPALSGAAANLTSTWTLTDTAGHTIPNGTRVAYNPPSGAAAIVYVTVGDFVVAPGSNTSGSGTVNLVAQVVGASGNLVPIGALSLLDNVAFVQAISANTAGTGGADPETAAAYVARLSATLRLLTPRPIVPSDFSALARSQAGVARATTVDGYNPANATTGNARMVAVCVIDINGNAPSMVQQNAVAAALQAQREVNFVVNLLAPTYTAVNVSAQLTIVRGASLSTVSAALTAALTNYLSKATWGGPPPQWNNVTAVRYLSLVALLAAVPGVAYVTGLQLSLAATAATASVDLVLPGAAPLPTAGVFNFVITPG